MKINLETINLDDAIVLCDICTSNYHCDKSGGILFSSYAICPGCEDAQMKEIKKFKEEKYIKAVCPKNVSFKDWVLSMRKLK